MLPLSGDQLWDEVQVGLLLVDGSGTIVRANPTCGRLFGYSPEELVESSIELLLAPGSRARHLSARARYQSDPIARTMLDFTDVEALRSDGSTAQVRVALTPLSIDGADFTLAEVHDVSARALVETALQDELELSLEGRRANQALAQTHDAIVQRLFVVGVELELLAKSIDDSAEVDRLRRAMALVGDVLEDARVSASAGLSGSYKQ